jgi:hypothetical protein
VLCFAFGLALGPTGCAESFTHLASDWSKSPDGKQLARLVVVRAPYRSPEEGRLLFPRPSEDTLPSVPCIIFQMGPASLRGSRDIRVAPVFCRTRSPTRLAPLLAHRAKKMVAKARIAWSPDGRFVALHTPDTGWAFYGRGSPARLAPRCLGQLAPPKTGFLYGVAGRWRGGPEDCEELPGSSDCLSPDWSCLTDLAPAPPPAAPPRPAASAPASARATVGGSPKGR